MKQVFSLVVMVLFLVSAPLAVHANGDSSGNTGYKGGFFIKNSEDTFQLKINGRFQPRFFFERNQSPALGVSTKRASFRIRRAYIAFTSTIHDKLSFGLGLLHGTNTSNFSQLNVASATGTYAVAPQFNVTLGMVGLPLDIANEMSSAWYLLPDPPITLTQTDGVGNITFTRNSFGVPEGLGVNFSGDISKFFYSVSMVNASESNYGFNNNLRMSLGARVGMNILDAIGGSMTDFAHSSDPKLTVSAGGMYQGKRLDDAHATPPEIKRILTGSVGTAFMWKGLSLRGETYYRRTKFNSFGSIPLSLQDSSLIDFGYYGAAGYYIVPKKFEIAGQAGQIFREGPDNNANQFGGGVNYYLHDNNAKVQVAYTWTQDYDDITGTQNNNIHNMTVQFQFAF